MILKPRLSSTLLAAALSLTAFPFLATEMPVEAPGLPTMRSLLRAELPDRRKKRKALRASRTLTTGYFGAKLCRVTTDEVL
jgi:hypothetical protein